MATDAFANWVSKALQGNSSEAVRVAAASVADVTFEAVIKVAVSSETKRERVPQAILGPSIEVAEAEARQRGDPLVAVEFALRNEPGVFLGANGRFAVPGWSFSQTKTQSCSGCGASGKIVCQSCKGGGRVPCGKCHGRRTVTCARCGGQNFVLATEQVRDSQGNVRYVQVRQICGCMGGQISCYDCSGSGQQQCAKCRGAGRLVCQSCSGAGKIHDRDTKAYLARHSVTSCSVKSDAEPTAFVRERWSELARRGCLRVTSFESSSRSGAEAVWNVSGAVSIETRTISVGGRDARMKGCIHPLVDGAPAVFESEPFLGVALQIDSWSGSGSPSAKLLASSSMRLARESIAAWDGAGSKEAEKRAAVEATLIKAYGPALSSEHRVAIADLVKRGMARLRSVQLARSWGSFALLSAVVGTALIPAVAFLVSEFEKRGATASPLVWLGILAGIGLWFVLGWFRAKWAMGRLGKLLGLGKKLKARQGAWNALGPVLALVGFSVGNVVGIFATVVLIAQTRWLDDGMRGQTLNDPAFQKLLFISRERILDAPAALRTYPADGSRVMANVPVGTKVAAVAAPVGGWTLVRHEDAFSWIQFPDTR